MMDPRRVAFRAQSSCGARGPDGILERALEGKPPTRRDALSLIRRNDIGDIFSLSSVASRVREKNFGRDVFVYGFVYYSTYCRNMCNFCFYRRSNSKCRRYRKDPSYVTSVAQLLEKSGAHLIDLTSGEDPITHNGKSFERIVELVKLVRESVDMRTMVSPGVVPRSVLRVLKDAGADWYALYQETHNRALFSRLRIGQDYDERVKAKLAARKEGLLVEDGILLGIGESDEDQADSIFAMKQIGSSQVRAMGFVPQEGTPMQNRVSPPIIDEMKTMAAMRLVHQDKLMPASLDIDGLRGLQLRLASGANVVSSVIPQGSGLAGVAQADLGVNEGLRTVEAVRPYIERIGLRIASKKSYARWLDQEKELQSCAVRQLE